MNEQNDKKENIMLLKINYTTVAVSNYQGGAGETVKCTEYVEIPETITAKEIKNFCDNFKAKDTREYEQYGDENTIVRSVEIILNVRNIIERK